MRRARWRRAERRHPARDRRAAGRAAPGRHAGRPRRGARGTVRRDRHRGVAASRRRRDQPDRLRRRSARAYRDRRDARPALGHARGPRGRWRLAAGPRIVGDGQPARIDDWIGAAGPDGGPAPGGGLRPGRRRADHRRRRGLGLHRRVREARPRRSRPAASAARRVHPPDGHGDRERPGPRRAAAPRANRRARCAGSRRWSRRAPSRGRSSWRSRSRRPGCSASGPSA